LHNREYFCHEFNLPGVFSLRRPKAKSIYLRKQKIEGAIRVFARGLSFGQFAGGRLSFEIILRGE
jgi:hypothetical protein